MIWAAMIDDTIAGVIRVPEGIKLTSKTYREPLPRLEELPLSSRREVIFTHDNSPSHSAKATTSLLCSLRIKGDLLVEAGQRGGTL